MTVEPASTSRFRSLGLAVVVSASTLLLLVPAARSETSAVTWNAPSPADRSRFSVQAGSQVAFRLSASTTVADDVVHIESLGGALPKGAAFTSRDGATAHASFRFTPSRVGDYKLRFRASTASATAPTLRYTIHVEPKTVYPRTYRLTDDKTAHWAVVLRRVVARARPTAASRAVATLETMTTDDTQNLVLILQGAEIRKGLIWYRVRLPILPNNSTGWVRGIYLGTLYTVHTHLYVDRRKLTATLTKYGRPVFKTIVGVGRSYWPTPAGEFYIRDKLTGFGDPVYGPVAFGTSARSSVLTDWPGGGFVGVHGTNEPQILPGYVSHGCIRMPNASILRLARLMPVGTPLTVT
jgi:hypothetical protein